MLVDGMSYIEENAALVIIPGLALTAVVVSFNLLGEAPAAELPAAVDQALALPPAERQAYSPMLAILSAQHEAQYSRLFRS